MNTVTTEGIALIKEYEGLRLTPYADAVGKQTIGYGHLILPNESFSEITEDQATALLMKDVKLKQGTVDYFIRQPVNDNQYSALVSLVYNLGAAPLTGTLGGMINRGEVNNPDGLIAAANQFSRWVYAGGHILDGLVRRRAAERELFLKPVA